MAPILWMMEWHTCMCVKPANELGHARRLVVSDKLACGTSLSIACLNLY